MGIGIARETSIGVTPFVLGKTNSWGEVREDGKRGRSAGEYAYCDISFEKLREISMHPEYKRGGKYPCSGDHRVREFLKTLDYELPIVKDTLAKLREEAKIWKDKLQLQPGLAKKVQWAETGAHLSMSRVYSGRTTFFKSRKKVKTPNKQVCLLITTALHGWASAKDYYEVGLMAYQRAILAARQNMAMTILLCDPCAGVDNRNNYFFLVTPVIKSKKVHNPSDFIFAALPIGLAGYWGFSGQCLSDLPYTGHIGRSMGVNDMLNTFPKIKKKIEDRYGPVEVVPTHSHLAHSVKSALKLDAEINSGFNRGVIST